MPISRYLVEPQSLPFGPRYSDWNAANNCLAKYPDTRVPYLYSYKVVNLISFIKTAICYHID